jgi:hypothetical protein
VADPPPAPEEETQVVEAPLAAETAPATSAHTTDQAPGSHPTEEPVGWPAEEPEQPDEEEPAEEPLGWPDDDPDAETGDERSGGAAQRAPGARRARRERRSRGSGEPFTLPAIPPRAAALVSGLLVGVLGVVLTFLAARGCELVRGVGSCGRIGLLALLVILAVEVLAGAVLLKAWRLSDPVSTSFLGVGLVAMFVLLFLMESLESTWVALVIPLLTAGTFLFSWWVTESFAEDPKETLFR